MLHKYCNGLHANDSLRLHLLKNNDRDRNINCCVLVTESFNISKTKKYST